MLNLMQQSHIHNLKSYQLTKMNNDEAALSSIPPQENIILVNEHYLPPNLPAVLSAGYNLEV